MSGFDGETALKVGRDLSFFNSRLQMLRELDSVIDFARGYLQLRIVLCLGSRNSLSTRDIASLLSERQKSVVDAIRKLVAKGLVARESDGGVDLYKLSDSGLEFYRRLQSIVGDGYRYRVSREERREMVLDIASEMTRYTHLADAIIAIATSKNGELTLADIADAMKLGVDRARTYIEMFSERRGGVRVFKRVEKTSKLLAALAKILKPLKINIKTTTISYRITDEGLAIFYRQPYYLKYKKSLASKIATKVFGSAHPRIVLKKMTLMMLAASLVTSLAALATATPVAIALCGSMTFATSLLYIGYKAV